MLDSAITLRPATTEDGWGLRRLAGLDSAPLPREPILLAADAENLLAALSLADGAVIADPFKPTAAAVGALRLWAAQLAGAGERPRSQLFSSGARVRFAALSRSQ